MKRVVWLPPLFALLAGALAGWATAERGEGRPPAGRAEGEAGRASGAAEVETDAAAASAAEAAGEVGDGPLAPITGLVTTVDGRPLAGVIVAAFSSFSFEDAPDRPEAAAAPPPGEALAHEIAQFVRLHRFNEKTAIRAVTGLDGRFSLTPSQAVGHRLEARLAGYVLEARDRAYARPGDEVRWIAQPILDVPVKVYDPDGRPAGPAFVEVVGGLTARVLVTPEEPYVPATPGPASFRAIDATGRAGPEVQVKLGDAPPDAPVRLALAGGTGIRGRLELPPGAGADGLTVAIRRIEAGAAAEPPSLLPDPDDELGFRRDYGREFDFPDLSPGRWLVGALWRDERVLATTVVEVRDRVARADLFVPPESWPEEGIAVRAFAPDGRPDPTTIVRARYEPSPGFGVVLRRAGEGAYRLVLAPAPRDVQVVLTAESRRYGRRTMEIPADRKEDVRFDWTAPSHLVVELTGAPPELLPKLEAELLAGDPPQGFAAPVDRLARDGRWDFGPVPPGEYRVRIAQQFPNLPILEEQVTARSGPSTATLRFPALHTLVVELEAGDDGEGFYLVRKTPEGSFQSRHFAVHGPSTVRFEYIPPGEYDLYRHRDERLRMPITVAGDAVVRFAPILETAVRVRILDPDGPLAAAGLKTGDLILAVDGVEITGPSQGRALLRAAEARSEARLTLRREGRTMELSAALLGTQDPSVGGGELAPCPR